MTTRPVSAGNAGSTTTSGDHDVLPGALVIVAAAVGLVRALAARGSSADACNELEPSPPDSPKQSRLRGVVGQQPSNPSVRSGRLGLPQHQLKRRGVS
jgi:hypothetical protein